MKSYVVLRAKERIAVNPKRGKCSQCGMPKAVHWNWGDSRKDSEGFCGMMDLPPTYGYPSGTLSLRNERIRVNWRRGGES